MQARHPQSRHDRRVARSRGPWLLLALACVLWIAALAGPGRADDGTLQVTTCDQSAADCESGGGQEIQVEQQPAPAPVAKPQPKPAAKPGPAPTAKGTERHDVSLVTGQDTVQTSDGVEDDQAEVTTASAKPDKPASDADRPAPEQPGDLSTVTTDAGSPFAGFGSGLAYLSPNEALSRFAIPPFLLPIYVAAGRAYGVPWNLLAAINQIETDFGRIQRQVSSAGALGWMQFMPATWRRWGVDASGDGVADPYNPVDAIYAAARYLKASGAPEDLRGAVLAYNNASWYADSVLKNAGIYGSLPGGLVDETGSLAFGRFPLMGTVRYADDFRRAQQENRTPRGIVIRGRRGARAVSTQQVVVKRILLGPELAAAMRAGTSGLERNRARPGELANIGTSGQPDACRSHGEPVTMPCAVAAAEAAAASRERLAQGEGGLPAGFADSVQDGIGVVVEDPAGNQYRYDGLARLGAGVRPGATLRGRQTIGRIARSADAALRFSLRAAGGAAVDPRPIIDGYRLQEAANFAHAVRPLGGNPFVPTDDSVVAAGVVSGSERALARKVLADPGISIYPGGRQDIERGVIDKRVLGALLYLRRSGLTLGVSSLKSGHGYYTSSGNVSAHSFGAAVDIASFDGQPVVGNQGPGSLIEQAIKLLMRLKGSARPAQLISLMNLGGPSFAMADHYDHLHMGYSFSTALPIGRSGDALGSVTFNGTSLGAAAGGAKATAGDERALAAKLGGIANPTVRKRASGAGIEVESESPDERAAVDGPLRVVPDAAGAQLITVAVPHGQGAGAAWALGIVDGRSRGWAQRQVVVLRHSANAWTTVGPPIDARGKVANPKLTALSMTARGGYAVGDDGAVVLVPANGAPRLLPAQTSASLRAVDARLLSASLTGVAVGTKGRAVELLGDRQRAVRAADGDTTLRSVVGGSAPIAVGSRAGRAVVVARGSQGWKAIDSNLGTLAPARLTAVARDGADLWIAGGLSDDAGADGATTRPLAARLARGRWRVWCAGRPALAGVSELGTDTAEGCEGTIAGGDAPGAVSGLAVTRQGVAIGAGGTLQLLRSNSFRPVPSTAAALSGSGTEDRGSGAVALGVDGRGWVVLGDGRLARVAGAGDRAALDGTGAATPPALQRGMPATVAVSPRGDRVLATSGNGVAYQADGRWASAPSPGTELRTIAAGASTSWAVTTAGKLLRLSGGGWIGDTRTSAEQRAVAELSRALGWGGIDPGIPVVGWADVSLDADGNGFAVGAGGAIARLGEDGWAGTEQTPAKADLASVAGGPAGAVAAGGTTLLERDRDGWSEATDAEALVDGLDFTATAATPDGTLLAAAGATIIARTPGTGGWKLAPVAPLGQPVRKLGAWRDAANRLHVLALVGEDAAGTVLTGDADGWRALVPPTLDTVGDVDLQPATGVLAIAGTRDGAPAVETMNLQEEAA